MLKSLLLFVACFLAIGATNVCLSFYTDSLSCRVNQDLENAVYTSNVPCGTCLSINALKNVLEPRAVLPQASTRAFFGDNGQGDRLKAFFGADINNDKILGYDIRVNCDDGLLQVYKSTDPSSATCEGDPVSHEFDVCAIIESDSLIASEGNCSYTLFSSPWEFFQSDDKEVCGWWTVPFEHVCGECVELVFSSGLANYYFVWTSCETGNTQIYGIDDEECIDPVGSFAMDTCYQYPGDWTTSTSIQIRPQPIEESVVCIATFDNDYCGGMAIEYSDGVGCGSCFSVQSDISTSWTTNNLLSGFTDCQTYETTIYDGIGCNIKDRRSSPYPYGTCINLWNGLSYRALHECGPTTTTST
jgi:hypothetical protein